MPGTEFQQRVWNALKKIPRGQVTTYQLLAKEVGRPRAARAVGNALNCNPMAPTVPCHRVVRADGSLGGYASGPKRKHALLTSEGVKIIKNKIALSKYLFRF